MRKRSGIIDLSNSNTINMNIPNVFLSGKEVFPIIDGGKGIGVSNGTTAGYFAAAGAVGTISLAFPPSSDDAGNLYPLVYKGKTRVERSIEIITQSVKESIKQINLLLYQMCDSKDCKSYRLQYYFRYAMLWHLFVP